MGNGITVRWQKHLEEIVQFAWDLLPITYYLLAKSSAFTVFQQALFKNQYSWQNWTATTVLGKLA
jgi:hypothetical protein